MSDTQARTAGGGPVIDIAEVLDAQDVNWFNVLLIVIGWFAIFGDGFDISSIGYVMPNLMKEFQFGPETVGMVSSASLAAYPIGALGLGWISDHHGRKPALIIGCLIVSIFTFANIFRQQHGRWVAALVTNKVGYPFHFVGIHKRALQAYQVAAG